MGTPLINLTLMKSVCQQLPDLEARQKFWSESLSLSISSLQSSVARFKNAIAARDVSELSQAAHKIVGTISFVGVQGLSDRLAMLQDECDANQISWPFTEESYYLGQFDLIIEELDVARKSPP